jgi:hypothetical protein
MARIWTPEERKKQAEAIRRARPWEKSTGPKTAAGKAQSRYNALKNGHHARDLAVLRRALRTQRQFLTEMRLWIAADKEARAAAHLLSARVKGTKCSGDEEKQGDAPGGGAFLKTEC